MLLPHLSSVRGVIIFETSMSEPGKIVCVPAKCEQLIETGPLDWHVKKYAGFERRIVTRQ